MCRVNKTKCLFGQESLFCVNVGMSNVFVMRVKPGDGLVDGCFTHRLLHADGGGCRVVEGGGGRLAEGRSRLHVEASWLLQVRLSREGHRPRGELRVHGLLETLGGHVEVLLGCQLVLIDGRGHWPHGGLKVVLGSEPHGALLARSGLIERGPALMGHVGHVKPGSRLDGPVEAHWTRTVKPHRAHLVRRAIEAHRPLLLEAHWSRSRTRSHVVEVLHGALKVARSGYLSLKPDWRLLTNGTIKPPGALRERRTIKPAHTIAASHWTVRNVGPGSIKPLRHVVVRRSTTIKPSGNLVVRPIKPRRLIIAPRSTTLVPPRRVGSGGAHVSGPFVPGGGMSSIMRRCVSWRVTVLSDRRQWSGPWRRLQDGFWRMGRMRVRKGDVQRCIV